MAYTDLEMKNFTQIAYADFEDAYNDLKALYPERDSFSISELIVVAKKVDPSSDFGTLKCLTPDQMQDWKVSIVQDHNSETGFYACVIETAPGEAAVAFRGSEDYHDPSNLVNDWLLADFGLLNSTETNQHAEVRRFFAEHADDLAKYDHIAMTGHSLGGNLAEYATIVSGEYGLSDKISQCISFDGPGFSDEFIARYHKEIAAMSGKMTHYQWSVVGGLLFNLPGVERVTCKVSNDANTKDNEKYNSFTRHDTKYLEFDENGNVKRGSKDLLAIFVDDFSKRLDGQFSFSPFAFVLLPYILISNGIADSKEIVNTIVQTVKTTYQKIHSFFEKWLNRNNRYFKVNTYALNADSDRVAAKIASVRTQVKEMFQAIQALNGMWKGPANTAFAAKFAKEQREINSYLKAIEGYANSVKLDSKAYSDCENKVQSVISSLKV